MVDLTLKKVVAYLFGISLFLFGAFWVLAGLAVGDGLVGGLILVGAGLFSLPRVRVAIRNRANLNFSSALVVGIVLVGTVVGVGFIGADLVSDSSGAGSNGDTAGSNEAPNPTATATPDQSLNHSIGESFQVGEGDQTIEYTVSDVSTTNNVGGEYGEDADGVFVVVRLEMENVGDESFDISSSIFTLVDSQSRSYDVDTGATIYAEDGVSFEQLNPGVTTEGIIVFDVPEEQSERQLKISPAGIFSDADPHYVRL